MKYFVILGIIVISLLSFHLQETEARTIAPLSIILEDDTIKQNSFIIADGGIPVITIQKGETVSFPFKVDLRGLEPLPVNFSHNIETVMPDNRQVTVPTMKIQLDPFYMILKPDEPQIMNVTITTLSYTQLGEHKIRLTAQYPQGDTLLSTRFDVLVVNEIQYENPNSNSKYPVPGEGIISDIYPVKKQFEMGIKFENLKCNTGHVLLQKYDGSPACVKYETVPKLVTREWGTSDNWIKISNTNSAIHYEIEGAKITSIQVFSEYKNPSLPGETKQTWLKINLESKQNGVLQITLPRNLIDSKIGNTDDGFFVLLDGTETEYNEAKTESERILNILFPANTDILEIIGYGYYNSDLEQLDG